MMTRGVVVAEMLELLCLAGDRQVRELTDVVNCFAGNAGLYTI